MTTAVLTPARKGARIIVVGDPSQAIYRFRGAGDGDETFSSILSRLQQTRNVRELLLPRNYRCDRSIAELTRRKHQPKFEGHSQAYGDIGVLSLAQACERANNDRKDIALPDGVNGAVRVLGEGTGPEYTGKECTFCFLCRINTPLVVTAYHLMSLGKRVCILGYSSLGMGLKHIVRDLCKEPGEKGHTNHITDLKDEKEEIIEDGFLTRLAHWFRVKSSKLTSEKDKAKLEKLQQDVDCLEIIAGKVKDDMVTSIYREIEALFSDKPKPGVITLSTVHRAKGKEWSVVFILRPDLIPHPAAKNEKEMKQEHNIAYVADTRPQNRFYYINTWPFGPRPSMCLPFDPPPSVAELLGVATDKALSPVAVPNYSVPQDKPAGEPTLRCEVARQDAVEKLKVAIQSPAVERPPVEKEVEKPNAGWQFPDDGEPF